MLETLSTETLEAVFDTLPVDLTFVDENGEDFQLALDDDGYVVIDKLKVKDLEIVEGGQMTLPDGENQITGTGIVPIDSDFAVIENNRIASTSKIFITFNSDLKGKSWWVCEKRDAELFRLCLSGTTNKELNFDYWIVQTMLTGTTTLEVISTTTEPVIEEPVVVEEEEEAPVVEEEEPVVEEEIVEDPVVEEEVAEEPVVEEEVAEEEPIIEEEEEPVVEAPILSPTESEEENRESAISEPNQDDLEEIGKEPVVEEEGI